VAALGAPALQYRPQEVLMTVVVLVAAALAAAELLDANRLLRSE
jgi:hypothetical protein